jgi:hypothetical protein
MDEGRIVGDAPGGTSWLTHAWLGIYSVTAHAWLGIYNVTAHAWLGIRVVTARAWPRKADLTASYAKI